MDHTYYCNKKFTNHLSYSPESHFLLSKSSMYTVHKLIIARTLFIDYFLATLLWLHHNHTVHHPCSNDNMQAKQNKNVFG